MERWQRESGAYTIGIGTGEPQAGKWPGHLITVVERKFLVDLTLDQGSRPQLKIMLSSHLVTSVNNRFLGGAANLRLQPDQRNRADLLRRAKRSLVPRLAALVTEEQNGTDDRRSIKEAETLLTRQTIRTINDAAHIG
jgi:hypothetical protein